MSKGINKVILIGNLGNDPEVRYLPSGAEVTNISLATSESWTDKNSGQKQEKTEWHRVTFFNKLAGVASKYLRKGSKVYIEGSLRTSKYQDQNGQDRYSTDVIAREMQMLDSKPQGQQQQGQQQPSQQFQGQQQQSYQGQKQGYQQGQQQPQQPQQQQAQPLQQYEDEIPF